jgi:UDPglucose 6-dehydrogenase
MYNALEKADALIISTEWSIFRTPNFDKVKELLSNPVIFDGRNLYDVNDMEMEGIRYVSIGRKEVN